MLVKMQTECLIEFLIVIPIVELFCTVSISWFQYQYIKAKKSVEDKSLYYLGMALFSSQIVYYVLTCFYKMYHMLTSGCSLSNSSHRSLLLGTIYILFSVQNAIMIALMFHRLNIVFKDTLFQLSKCTVVVYITFYVLGCIFGAFWGLILSEMIAPSAMISTIVLGISTLLVLSICAMLTFLFVYKLIMVNKYCTTIGSDRVNKDEKMKGLIATITKISILTLISIITLLIDGFVAFVVQNISNSIHIWFAWTMIVIIDVYTNFVCIYLSFQAFDKYYVRIFGCCDAGCKQLCTSTRC